MTDTPQRTLFCALLLAAALVMIFALEACGQVRITNAKWGTATAPAQPEEFALSLDRAPSTWRNRVGVEGGIPDSSLMTVYTNLATNATLADFNAAVSACPPDQVIQLTNGTYGPYGGFIAKQGKSNMVIRGVGKTNTTIRFTSGGINFIGWPQIPFAVIITNPLPGIAGHNSSSPDNVVDWTAGYTNGCTNITLSSVAGLQVGYIIGMDQTNDFDGVSAFDSQSGAAYTGRGGQQTHLAGRALLQMNKVKAINGNVVTIDVPLCITNWRSSQSPQVWWTDNQEYVRRIGIEDMTVDTTGSGGATPYGGGIQFEYADNCWVKNVKSVADGQSRTHIFQYVGFRLEVRDCDIFGEYGETLSYGVSGLWSSSVWVENNYFHRVTGAVPPGWASHIWAITYNYVYDNSRLSGGTKQNWHQGAVYMHNAHGSSWLLEGNHINGYTGDYEHGSGGFNTLFRNRITGQNIVSNIATTVNTYPIRQDWKNRNMNVYGNILGQTNYHTNLYRIYSAANGDDQKSIFLLGLKGYATNAYDTNTFYTLQYHANFDVVTNGVVVTNGWSTNLANSLIYTNKPTFFGAMPWPPYGHTNGAQTVTNFHSYTNIPAGMRHWTFYNGSPP